MAYIRRKKDVLTGTFFDKSKNQSTWPMGVIQNAKSPTGYSYGTLDEITPLMGIGYVKIDGFVVNDLTWIVIDGEGNAWSETNEEYQKKYTV